MSPMPFARGFRWFFMRFCSERRVRYWFEKKSGGKNEMFQYKADISTCKKVIIFLPVEQDKFFVVLPLAVALSATRDNDSFMVVTDENNRYILRALNLEWKSLFYNSKTMLYGEEDFFEMEKKVQEQKWDLCIFLQENATLPYLYLARATRASYRMGMKQEFPFLNIALKNSSNSENIYTNRNFLYKTFQIDSKNTEQECIRTTQKNERQNYNSRLSSSNTILLNLEPPINGEPWAESEVFAICKAFQPGWRLITIAATAKQLEPYMKVMEELDMRSNPILLHSESIFSVLRQYPAIVTLNSLHAHLFLNLSNIKVLMLEQNADYEIPNNQRMLKFGRDGNFYSFSRLATDFLKEAPPPKQTPKAVK
ncbi:MAG: hypothetical protein LBB36_01710 [Fibromonadaceae bacterium]|jgi:hypothetical protein|nr:hypothetical protein [Fibromonadaceae bacterium]